VNEDTLRHNDSADNPEVDWRPQVRAEIVSLICPKNPRELEMERRANGAPAFGSALWGYRSRRGLVEMIIDLGANAHETIQFNWSQGQVSYEYAAKQLRRWNAIVHRRFLGKRWLRSELRMPCIAIPEKGSHWHIARFVPRPLLPGYRRMVEFEGFDVIFERKFERGSAHSEMGGAPGIAWYVCKEAFKEEVLTGKFEML
jgi:hypothetical protein